MDEAGSIENGAGVDRRSVLGLDRLRSVRERLSKAFEDSSSFSKTRSSNEPNNIGKDAHIKPAPKMIARREAIKNAALASIAMIGTMRTINKLVRDTGEVVMALAEKEILIDRFIDIVATVFLRESKRQAKRKYGVDLELNPEKKPMLQLIKNGVAICEQKSGQRASFAFDQDRLTDMEGEGVFSKNLEKVSLDDILAFLKGNPEAIGRIGGIKEKIINEIGSDRYELIYTSDNFTLGYLDVSLIPGSGFEKRVSEILTVYNSLSPEEQKMFLEDYALVRETLQGYPEKMRMILFALPLLKRQSCRYTTIVLVLKGLEAVKFLRLRFLQNFWN